MDKIDLEIPNLKKVQSMKIKSE